ncbi:hypothetical protein IQ07DRAFT_91497 [Pyrenochaeta sp. DS3sAY3a]|nr:hypothetical protein IQ07DRAFT_91497 [Pyrenochaeta sp. DS3sAY3a]
MRVALILSALAALAIARPHPQESGEPSIPEHSDEPDVPELPTPTVSVPLSTSLNVPVTSLPSLPGSLSLPSFSLVSTSSSRRKPHWEPIPIFTKQCQCELKTARYPCWATDALQRCNFEENFSFGCYMSAAGGCPTPTRVCSALFQPTPRTSGRHPCELGPNPPVVTSPPDVSSVLASLTASANLTVTVTVPPVSVNATVTGGMK